MFIVDVKPIDKTSNGRIRINVLKKLKLEQIKNIKIIK